MCRNYLKFILLFFLYMSSFSSLFAGFYVIPIVKKVPNVIHVAASGGDFTSPVDAMNSITDASAENPYLIVLDSGTFELLGTRLIIKSFVDIVGQGRDVTTIRGGYSFLTNNNEESAFVIAQNHTKIKSLKLENYGGGDYANTLFCGDANVTLEDLYIEKKGDNGNTKASVMALENSYIYAKNIDILMQDATTRTYGIYINGSTLFADNVNITDLSMSNDSYGLFLTNNSYVDFRNASMDILVNNNANYGVFVSTNSEITITDTTITVDGSDINHIDVKNHGVKTILNAVAMLNNVSIIVTGHQSKVVNNSVNSRINVMNSFLSGEFYSYAESNSYLAISYSKLIGLESGSTVCLACVDINDDPLTEGCAAVP